MGLRKARALVRVDRGGHQNVTTYETNAQITPAQCSTLFGNPIYRISIPMCLPHMPTDASFAASWLMRCDRLFQIRLHLTFQSVQRGKTDGDAASPFPKSQRESQPRATRIPHPHCTHGAHQRRTTLKAFSKTADFLFWFLNELRPEGISQHGTSAWCD